MSPSLHWSALVCLMLLIGLVGPGTLYGSEAPTDDCPSHIWISYGKRIKEKDGSVTQRFFIRGRGDDRWPLAAVYEICDQRGRGQCRHHTAVISDETGVPFFDITVGDFSRVSLAATAVCGARKLRAHTVAVLFGKSSNKTRPPPGEAAWEKDAPWLALTPEWSHYWMETGTPYEFRFTGGQGGSAVVDVMEMQKKIQTFETDNLGAFSYTPPNDRNLDRGGPSAYKETVVVVGQPLKDIADVASFTLVLHRSRHGHRRLGPGLAVFAFTAILVAAGVGMKRRRRPF